ncbi:MAG: helix-turn-helix domain-containing protein [Proteobacteria bacterium]|nr:helix-turn-helix domain-containing protein [Pseudomonadota bacterium]
MPSEATQRSLEEQIRRMTPVSAPPEQQADAARIFRLLDRAAQGRRPRFTECRLVGPAGESIGIPEAMFYVLERVAELLARGDSLTIVPVGKELTTQQAADLLNVSRQYLVRLLNDGRIPFTKTGKHRRLRIEDVLGFKEQRDRERREGLDELTRMSEEFGGYEELK